MGCVLDDLSLIQNQKHQKMPKYAYFVMSKGLIKRTKGFKGHQMVKKCSFLLKIIQNPLKSLKILQIRIW